MRATKTLGLGAAALVLLMGPAGALPVAPPAPAGAQNTNIRHVDLFGESDEEKQARQQHEDGQDSAIQTLTQRVHDLEETLRQVTGENEQLTHRVQELNEKMDRQEKDFEYRLCAMSAQQLGATPGQPGENSIPCNQGGNAMPQANVAPAFPAAPPTAAIDASGQVQPSGVPQLGKPPGVLGTLSTGDAVPLAPAASAASTQPQFDAAMDMLAKAQYDEARAAFRAFADANPKDPLAGQAVYWIGDIAYVQHDYPNAAHAFAEEIKKYPTSTRGPDSMLKLGQSLIAMGQKKEGCTALAALPSRYPNASKNIAGEAASTRRTVCR
jgi:tol-pal system protein YbgF